MKSFYTKTIRFIAIIIIVRNSLADQRRLGTTLYDHPLVSEVYQMWRIWLPGERDKFMYTGHLKTAKKVDEPCTVSPEEDASLAFIRVFLGNGKPEYKPPVTNLGFDHNPHRFLAGSFLFFLRKTENLKPTDGKLDGTYCNNDYESKPQSAYTDSFDSTNNVHTVYSNFDPPSLVCNKGHCQRCDHSDVTDTEACRTLNIPQVIFNTKTFTLDDSLEHSSLSDDQLQSWANILRMTPQEFKEKEKTNSDLLSSDHYIVTFMLQLWRSWLSKRDENPAEICEVGDEEQLGLKSVETLFGMTDPKNHLARNFMFYLKQTEKFREEDIPLFCGKGEACYKGKCIECEKVSWTMTNENSKPNSTVPSKLYLACVVTDPMKEGRFILPVEMPIETTTASPSTPALLENSTYSPLMINSSGAICISANNKYKYLIQILLVLMNYWLSINLN